MNRCNYTLFFLGILFLCCCSESNVVKLKEEVVLLDSINGKLKIKDICSFDKTIVFWFSEACCHACVVKEIKRIDILDSTLHTKSKILFVTPNRPLRNWRTKYKFIRTDYNLTDNFYCLYNFYSFTSKESTPYYFVFDKKKNCIENVFYPDRNSPMKTYKYLVDVVRELEY